MSSSAENESNVHPVALRQRAKIHLERIIGDGWNTIESKRSAIQDIVASHGAEIIHERVCRGSPSYPLVCAFRSLRLDVVDMMVNEFQARPQGSKEEMTEVGADFFYRILNNVSSSNKSVMGLLIDRLQEIFGVESLDMVRNDERLTANLTSHVEGLLDCNDRDAIAFIMRQLHVTGLSVEFRDSIAIHYSRLFLSYSLSMEAKQNCVDYAMDIFGMNSINFSGLINATRPYFPIYYIIEGMPYHDEDLCELFRWFIEQHPSLILEGYNDRHEHIDTFTFVEEKLQRLRMGEQDFHTSKRIRVLEQVDFMLKAERRRNEDGAHGFKRARL